MPTRTALATVVGDQKRWSSAAGSLKSSIENARLAVLWLIVLGAVLETSAAQLAHVSRIEEIKTAHATHSGLAMALGYLGAAALAVAAIFRQWKLGQERIEAWVLCRSGSESLKREMYRYRTQTGLYASNECRSGTAEPARRDSGKAQAVPEVRRRTLSRAPVFLTCWTRQATSSNASPDSKGT